MTKRTKEEMEHELATLKLEHDLAKSGLAKGQFTVIAVIAALLVSLFGGKSELLTGNQYVLLVAIVVAAILIYFAFVFSRELKIKAKISEKIKELEMSAGDKVS